MLLFTAALLISDAEGEEGREQSMLNKSTIALMSISFFRREQMKEIT